MTESWPVHTLVFDLDDTLYSEREFVRGGFAAVDARLRQERGVVGFADRAWALFEQGRRGRIFDEALPMLGLEPAPGLVADLVEVYRDHPPQLTLYPDAREILSWAVPRFRLALITDGFAAVQERKIKALGLETMIGCRIISDELGREFWKPSPEPYRRVMARYPGPADGYAYVGDNPRKDFSGARQLGWRTVRVRRPDGEHAAHTGGFGAMADSEIDSLLEIKTLIIAKTAGQI